MCYLFFFDFFRSAKQTLNDEMEKENVFEQQTYDVDEDTKSVIKKIIAKYREHKKELQFRARNATESDRVF